jgi:tRNA(Ile)-lysidine synthase
VPSSPPISRRAPPKAAPTPSAAPELAAPELSVVAESLVERFATDVVRLTGKLGNIRIGLAVSGGPDSLGLLLLAAAAFPGRIEAATVDHGLRTASRAEADFVAAVCKTRRIPHQILPVTVAETGNLSAAAREARYAALDTWRQTRGLTWIATAHHAEDQLETLVMRLNRSAGVAGLAGVRARQGHVIRPLIGWRRCELADTVVGAGIVAIDDPCNHDDRFDRARLRKALATADWLDPLAASKSAALLADADAALDWAVDALASGADPAILNARTMASCPAEIVRRCVLRAVRHVDPNCRPRGDALTRLIEALVAGRTATLGHVMCSGRHGQWHFEEAPARRIVSRGI